MRLRRFVLKWLLLNSNKKHLNEHRSQLVGYAFDHITAKIHVDGRFEDRELQALEKVLFPKLAREGVCLDIGANIGNHAICFADYFSKVYAFEPNPKVYKVLEINSELRSNIIPHMVGCSSSEAVFQLEERLGNLGGASLKEHEDSNNDETVQIKVVALDESNLIDASDSVSFVKIDVEGHEPHVIEGAKKLLMHHKPIVAFEVGRRSVKNGTCDPMEALRKLGYNHFYEFSPKHSIASLFKGGEAIIRQIDRLKRKNYTLIIARTEALEL